MVAIRAATARDAGAIAAIYAPHVVDGIASFETTTPGADVMAARMASSDGRLPWLVATDARDDVLGYAYTARFHPRVAYDWTVETTIYLAEDAQGRGVGRLLYTALIETLIAQGFTQAIALISLPNAASAALHERLGFARTGTFDAVGYKHGRWIDVGVWQRALLVPANPPLPPVPPLNR